MIISLKDTIIIQIVPNQINQYTQQTCLSTQNKLPVNVCEANVPWLLTGPSWHPTNTLHATWGQRCQLHQGTEKGELLRKLLYYSIIITCYSGQGSQQRLSSCTSQHEGHPEIFWLKKMFSLSQNSVSFTSIESLLNTISFISMRSSCLEPFRIFFLTSTSQYSSWKSN